MGFLTQLMAMWHMPTQMCLCIGSMMLLVVVIYSLVIWVSIRNRLMKLWRTYSLMMTRSISKANRIMGGGIGMQLQIMLTTWTWILYHI